MSEQVPLTVVFSMFETKYDFQRTWLEMYKIQCRLMDICSQRFCSLCTSTNVFFLPQGNLCFNCLVVSYVIVNVFILFYFLFTLHTQKPFSFCLEVWWMSSVFVNNPGALSIFHFFMHLDRYVSAFLQYLAIVEKTLSTEVFSGIAR